MWEGTDQGHGCRKGIDYCSHFPQEQSVIDLVIPVSLGYSEIGDNTHQRLSEVTGILDTQQMTAKVYYIVPDIRLYIVKEFLLCPLLLTLLGY